MKKEVQLTLIVNTDDSDRKILLDLKTEINRCSNIYEVTDYNITSVESHGTSIIYPVDNLGNDFCIN